MRSINLADIKIKGELAVRSGLNFTRLEGEWYRPDEVFKADSHGWPGDWEGRIILGLALLAQATHRTPAWLDEIVSLIPEHLNEKGYFGQILPEGKFDEQHFGGHSWIIRGLVEYYYMKPDEKVKKIIEDMVRSFLLPVRGSYSRYPIEPVKRFEDQDTWVLSRLQTKTKHHAETSDAGCAFIMLDGASIAYEFLGWPELKEIVEEIISRYAEMDFQKLHIQTHATLSGVRGILRFYEITGEARYLDIAVKIFDMYKKAAWTESYGNYNWFGAPRWTEPCAIIDSFIVAVWLWKHTGEPVYLNDAHLIYFNALSHGSRINGSFGTDRCCGAAEAEDNLFLTPVNYETYWCCTMRGGEGYSRAIEYNFFIDGNTAFLPFYNNCAADLRLADGVLKVEEKTKYPYYGNVSLEILEASGAFTSCIRFFIPMWADRSRLAVYLNGRACETSFENGFITLSGVLKAGDRIDFDLNLTLRAEDACFENSVKGYHKFLFGPMLLGLKAKAEINSLDGNRFENYAESRYKSAGAVSLPKDAEFERTGRNEFLAKDKGIVLSCLCDVKDMIREDSMRQILFKD